MKPRLVSVQSAVRTSRRLLAIASLLLPLGGLLQAATYYVSTSGNNLNNGTTEGTPWKTISKVNSATLNVGDDVRFKRGNTWSGSTNGGELVAKSGVKYWNYGDTAWAKPRFDGTGLTGQGVNVNNKNGVTIQGLDFRNSEKSGISIQGGSNTLVKNVDVYNNRANAGIVAAQGYGHVIDGCTVTNGKSNGIMFKGSATNAIRDSIIQNCTVTGTVSNDGIVIHAEQSGGQFHQAGSNFTIKNNTVTGAYEQGYDITTGSNVTMERNTSYANRAGGMTIGHTAFNVKVRWHTSYGEPTINTKATLSLSTKNITVEYSHFTSGSNNKPVVLIKNHDKAIFPSDHMPNDIVLRNNVFVRTNTAGGNVFQIDPIDNPGAYDESTYLKSLTMQNNIFYFVGGASTTVPLMAYNETSRPPNSPGFTINYHVYRNSNTSYPFKFKVGSTTYSFASYKTTFGKDAASNLNNPNFYNVGSRDYRINTGSSAANAGTNYTGGLGTCYYGFTAPKAGTNRDIGVHEGF